MDLGVTLKYIWNFFVGRGLSDFLDDNKIDEVNSIEIRELREQFTVSKINELKDITKLLDEIKNQIVRDYLFRNGSLLEHSDYKITIVGDGKEFCISEEL